MIKNLILLVSSLSLCVILGEVGLRFVVDEVNFLTPELMDHPVLRHAIVPGSSGHDEWGFRNREVPAEAQIVAIGDSQTYGTSVPASESWPAWIGRLTDTTVYNMGVGGYGPPDYRYLLNHKAKLLKPCLVFIGFYFGNDLPRSYHFAKHIEGNSVTPDEQTSGKYFMGLRTWLSHNSLIYQMTKALGGGLIDYMRFHEAQWNADGQNYPVIADNWSTILKPAPKLEALDQSREANRIGLSESLRILDGIHDDCQKLDTRCVIVLIPTKLAVYWPIASKVLSGEGYQRVHAAVEEEDKVRQAVSSYLKSRGIGFVDPLEALQAAAEKDPLYPGNADGHMNIRGNEVLADSLLEGSKSASRCHRTEDTMN